MYRKLIKTYVTGLPKMFLNSYICMCSLVFFCTESFRKQYLQMLELMATSQYRDRILAEIKLQSVSWVFATLLLYVAYLLLVLFQ